MGRMNFFLLARQLRGGGGHRAYKAAWPALVKSLDVADDRIPHRLHGLQAGPCNVWRHDNVGSIQDREQRIVLLRRLACQAIESDPCDQAKLESLHKVSLVDEAAAAAI